MNESTNPEQDSEPVSESRLQSVGKHRIARHKRKCSEKRKHCKLVHTCKILVNQIRAYENWNRQSYNWSHWEEAKQRLFTSGKLKNYIGVNRMQETGKIGGNRNILLLLRLLPVPYIKLINLLRYPINNCSLYLINVFIRTIFVVRSDSRIRERGFDTN